MQNAYKFFIIFLLFAGGLSCSKKDPTQPLDPEPRDTFESIIRSGGDHEKPIPSETTEVLSNTTETRGDGSIWQCTTTKVDVTKAPLEYATFNPNAEVIYPGSLLQGNSLDSPTPNPIVVKRAGGTISIDLKNGSPRVSATVPEVTRSAIGEALNEIIRQNNGILTARFTYVSKEVQSREQLALEMGVNVKTMQGTIDTKLSFSNDKQYNRYMISLNQSFYTIFFDLPTSPAEIYAPEVTPQDLARYVGPGNPATYISSVTYGRRYYLLIESTSSIDSMEASIKASYKAAIADVDIDGNVKYVKDLKEVNIKVFAVGGDTEKALATFNGDFNEIRTFLKEGDPIEAGAELSYVLRSVKTNQVVNVKVATTYEVKHCTPLAAGSDAFTFLPLQSYPLSIGTPAKALMGDIDGNDMMDMIWNHTGASGNEIVCGIANGDGTFSLTTPVFHPETPPDGSWGLYETHTGDINGDGNTDLIWSYLADGAVNRTYIGLSNGDGTFDFKPGIQHFAGGWRDYDLFIGDVDNDKNDDLIWNTLRGSSDNINQVYVGESNGDGTFVLRPGQTIGRGFGSYDPKNTRIGNLDGDGRIDLVWSSLKSDGNVTWTGTRYSNGVFEKSSQAHGGGGWQGYRLNIGNVDDLGGDDFVWDETVGNGFNRIYVGLSNSSGGYSPLPYQDTHHSLANSTASLLADVSGEGRKDLIWNDHTTSTNQIIVGLATPDGIFDFSQAGLGQIHPVETNWNQFTVFTGDITGDGREDIIWNHPDADNRIYVGLAK